MNFIAMDFETANAKRYSACSLALVMVKQNQIVGRYYSLINPETDFHWKNIKIHGIKPDDVLDAPKFPEVWQNIQDYFDNEHLIVAHNAAFDNSVLKNCLAHYNLDLPHYLSLCTLRTSRKLLPNLENHRLNTVSSALGINLINHHHALDDSIACANILIQQEQTFGDQPLETLIKYI